MDRGELQDLGWQTATCDLFLHGQRKAYDGLFILGKDLSVGQHRQHWRSSLHPALRAPANG